MSAFLLLLTSAVSVFRCQGVSLLLEDEVLEAGADEKEALEDDDDVAAATLPERVTTMKLRRRHTFNKTRLQRRGSKISDKVWLLKDYTEQLV